MKPLFPSPHSYLVPRTSYLILALALALLAACSQSPQVCINEICGKDNSTGDWIELYNAGTATVSLNGWYLLKTDEYGIDQTLFEFQNETIPPGGYLVVSRLADDLERKISHKKEVGIELVGPNDRTIDAFYRDDEIGESPHPIGGSYARFPDGNGAWQVATHSTPGTSNQ